MNEVWRDIPGYEGLYQVSDLGRVKSLPQDRAFGDLGVLRIGERIRKLNVNHLGQLTVALKKDGRSRTWTVSSLVLRAFVGLPERGFVTGFHDGDRKNVRLDNLYYTSRKAIHEELAKRGAAGRQKLTVADVTAIRSKLQTGEKGSALAKEFGVDPSTISLIKNNKRFGWLP